MPSTRAWREANAKKQCVVAGCCKGRDWASKCCSYHARIRTMAGHPLGRTIKLTEIKPYARKVDDFFERHANARQIKVAEGWLDSFIQGDVLRYSSGPPGEHLQRLAGEGLTGQEALRWLTGLWLYSFYQPRALADDLRLTYALGDVFTKLRPRPRKSHWTPKKGYYTVRIPALGSAKGKLGGILRQRLSVFCMRVIEGLEAEDTRAADLHETLGAPFTVPGYADQLDGRH